MITDGALIVGEEPPLERALRDEVARRMGLPAAVPLTYEGLRQVYAAWCAHLSFDNLRKVIALRTGRELPGRTAEDFFTHWLKHDAAGTCWPTSNALLALVRSYGFPALRSAGSMHDSGPMNHGCVRVPLGAETWFLDGAMLTVAPVRLSDRVEQSEVPLLAAESEPDQGAHLVWADFAPSGWLPCRVYAEPISRELHLQRYEASREVSPFNGRLFLRKNAPNERRALIGPTRVSKTEAGVTSRALTRDELCASLRDEFGISSALIEEWIACGGLDASYEEEPASAKPAPVHRPPPSQR